MEYSTVYEGKIVGMRFTIAENTLELDVWDYQIDVFINGKYYTKWFGEDSLFVGIRYDPQTDMLTGRSNV